MKEYIAYMDKISVDNELHKRIMQQIIQKPAQPHQNRYVFRYAGMAACAAVLLFSAWKFGLWSAPAEDLPNNSAVMSSNSPQSSEYNIVETSPPSDSDTVVPGLRDETWPLTLNKADSQLSAEIYIPGHFWYELNSEQLDAVFPDFPLALTATANYRGDGSLYNVMAYEVAADGDLAFYNEYYPSAIIEVIGEGGGGMGDVVYYGYEPATSDVAGVSVTAGVFDFKENDGIALYIASFILEGVAYNIHLHDNDIGNSGVDRLTQIVNDIIFYGAADLSVLNDPVIPELRDETLTLEEARRDPDFGVYMPSNVPTRFSFDSALRFINQRANSLSVYWLTGYDSINWHISKATEYDLGHIVSPGETEKYDLSLYPIPRYESVPSEFREYVDHPVFLAEELTLDVIKARSYYVDNDRGDTPGWRIDFNVLYGDILVSVNTKGISQEQVWDMLNK